MVDQRRQNFQALARALPSLDNLLALPRRRVDEAISNLGKAIDLNTMQKRRSFDLAVSRLTPVALRASLNDRQARIRQVEQVLKTAIARIKDHNSSKLDRMARMLQPVPQQLSQRIMQNGSQISQLQTRSDNAVKGLLRSKSQQVSAHDRMLQSLAYTNVLKRGFAVVRDQNNKPLTLAKDIASGQALNIQFTDDFVSVISQDGELTTRSEPDEALEMKTVKPAKKIKKPKPDPKDQGSLF